MLVPLLNFIAPHLNYPSTTPKSWSPKQPCKLNEYCARVNMSTWVQKEVYLFVNKQKGKKKSFLYKNFLPCLNRAYKCTFPWENVWTLFLGFFEIIAAFCLKCSHLCCYCPGNWASQGVFIIVALTLLHNIHISHAESEQGRETVKWGEESQLAI